MVRLIESRARDIFTLYGYKEIITPVFEQTELFTRSIGENTDIVQKEMYTFRDRKGRLLALRPEGTAPVIRAYIEHSLFNGSPTTRLFYLGPMFRYEKPQTGRQREFFQIGAECIGSSSPFSDTEIILLALDLLKAFGLEDFCLQVNSVGCKRCRPEYSKRMKDALKPEEKNLCSACRQRLQRSPLRVLDCKIDRERIRSLPPISEYLCEECRSHFRELTRILKSSGVTFQLNPYLVRGLDYYTRTAFEIVSELLGSQNALAAGGRYDLLVQELGGPDMPATGFALGMERVLHSLKKKKLRSEGEKREDCFIASLGSKARERAFLLLGELRGRGISGIMDYGDKSLKSQMRQANKYGVLYSLIIGEDELKRGIVILRDMKSSQQEEISLQSIIDELYKKIRD